MDLNADGNVDLISGSWPGELFLFRGLPNHEFSPPEMIQDKDGEYINIGGGISEDGGGAITITGHGVFEEVDGKHFVTYHGVQMESTFDRPISVTGTASAVHAADMDADGDFDLVVGDIGGHVYLIPNEGNSTDYEFGQEQPIIAGGEELQVQGGDAGPFAVDWDGDNDLDLVVGAGDGSVLLFNNTGDAKSAEFAAAEELLPKMAVAYGPDAPNEPARGIRSKVCVTDWNGDGLHDLLVGDYTTQASNHGEPSIEQQAEYDELNKELEELNPKFSSLIQVVLERPSKRSKEEYEKAAKELQEINKRRQEIYETLPQPYESHGWVWLFTQKPGDKL